LHPRDYPSTLRWIHGRSERGKVVFHQPTCVDVKISDSTRTTTHHRYGSPALSGPQRELTRALAPSDNGDPLTNADGAQIDIATVLDCAAELHSRWYPSSSSISRPHHLSSTDGRAVVQLALPARRAAATSDSNCADDGGGHETIIELGLLNQLKAETPEGSRRGPLQRTH